MLSKMEYEVSGITRVRGRIYRGNIFGYNIRIIATFHPAAALYNAKLEDYLEKTSSS